MKNNFPPPAPPLSIIATHATTQAPPIPKVINVLFHNVASLSRNDASSLDRTSGNFPYHPNHTQPAHPHLDSHHLAVEMMMNDDESMSTVSSIFEMDDSLTNGIFPHNDDDSLSTLLSPPLIVVMPFAFAAEEEDHDDDSEEEENGPGASGVDFDDYHVDVHDMMMNEDDTMSAASSIFDMDDFFTIDTFPDNDDGSLYTLLSPPLLVMMQFYFTAEEEEDDNDSQEEEIEENGSGPSGVDLDVYHEDGDDDDVDGEEDDDEEGEEEVARSGASMDSTEDMDVFHSREEVLQTYPLALFNGRGASNVHNPSYQVYMAQSRVLQPSYQAARSHTEKWRVERQLIDTMEQQGRVFIQRNVDGTTFQLMSEAKKREKVQKRLYVNPRRNVNVPLLPPVPPAPLLHIPQPLVPPPPDAPQALLPPPPHAPQVLAPPPPPNPQPLEPPVGPDVATHRSEIMEDDDSVSTKTNMEDNDVLFLPFPSFSWGVDLFDNPPLVPQLPFLELPNVDSYSMDDDVSVLTYNMDMDFALDDPPLFPPNAISFPIRPPLSLSVPPRVPVVLLMEDDDTVSTTL